MDGFVAVEVAFALIEALREPVKAIRRSNKDLADQLLRSAVSVASNIEEGRGREKGDRRHLWSVAYGSAREDKMQLRCAVALGLVEPHPGAELVEKADRLVGLCYGLARSRKYAVHRPGAEPDSRGRGRPGAHHAGGSGLYGRRTNCSEARGRGRGQTKGSATTVAARVPASEATVTDVPGAECSRRR